jgi:hypothetical protein
MNDVWEGDDTKTGEVDVSAWYADGTVIATKKYGYENPAIEFTAEKGGTVYARVTPEWGTGTYGIVYSSTSNIRPSASVLPSPNFSVTSPDVTSPDTVLENSPKKPKIKKHGLKAFRQMIQNRLQKGKE